MCQDEGNSDHLQRHSVGCLSELSSFWKEVLNSSEILTLDTKVLFWVSSDFEPNIFCLSLSCFSYLNSGMIY